MALTTLGPMFDECLQVFNANAGSTAVNTTCFNIPYRSKLLEFGIVPISSTAGTTTLAAILFNTSASAVVSATGGVTSASFGSTTMLAAAVFSTTPLNTTIMDQGAVLQFTSLSSATNTGMTIYAIIRKA